MADPQALVIGGTGPTGPFIVDGLVKRGYKVTILHGGQHEVEFSVPDIEHIHTDPHFQETLEPSLGSREWDLVVAQYGRLRIIADVFVNRTARIIGIGASNGVYAPDGDPRWGPLGRPAIVPGRGNVLVASPEQGKLAFRMAEAMQDFLEHHAQGHYSATYVAYPNNYGPRQPGPLEWAIMRRVLDGRRRIVIADGGIKLESRVFTENAAHGVMLVVDNPEIAAGKRYSVADEFVYSMRQRIQFIASHLGHEFEMIDMPYEVAWPAYPFWRHRRDHLMCESGSIRQELGYVDPVSTDEGLARTIDWIMQNRPEPGDELERQVGDPFDYEAEDELIDRWLHACEEFGPVESPLPGQAHFYRHPKTPGEQWQPPPAGQGH